MDNNNYVTCLRNLATTTINQYLAETNTKQAETIFYINYAFILKFSFVSRETINPILHNMEIIHNSFVDNEDKWQAYTNIENTDLSELLKIIDDGLTNGFKFKVENHMLFFQEID